MIGTYVLERDFEFNSKLKQYFFYNKSYFERIILLIILFIKKSVLNENFIVIC